MSCVFSKEVQEAFNPDNRGVRKQTEPLSPNKQYENTGVLQHTLTFQSPTSIDPTESKKSLPALASFASSFLFRS